MNKKLTLVLIITLVIISTTTSYATFTTGQGKHTFKIESLKADNKIRLQSFLVGLGLSKRSAINFKLTANNDSSLDEKQDMSFLIPSFPGIEKGNEFHLNGPILDIMYQYIPNNELFVTPTALNAIQGGLKTFQGKSYIPEKDGYEAGRVGPKTYFVMGILSRSRFDSRNLFSDIQLAYDPDEEGGWLFDSQIGMEFKIIDNFRAHVSYKAIGSAIDSKQGISLGLRVDY